MKNRIMKSFCGVVILLVGCGVMNKESEYNAILTQAIEQERINLRFPHVSDIQGFISLDNGTLIDKRLFEAWTVHNPREMHFNEDDLWLIFDLIIRHFDYINAGDEDGLRSTMEGMDGSDGNHFHPLIWAFMEEQKGSSLFVERIILSSFGFAIRVIISNDRGDEFHVWPLIDGSESWRIIRYFNHITLRKDWWPIEYIDLWAYIITMHIESWEHIRPRLQGD
ncbi:MAG: hypothetical protein FWC32_00360 [Firmicutes bacterium]|nr:hypothetical protein [Bacillota bacterium]